MTLQRKKNLISNVSNLNGVIGMPIKYKLPKQGLRSSKLYIIMGLNTVLHIMRSVRN